jgi:hypothetical protein
LFLGERLYVERLKHTSPSLVQMGLDLTTHKINEYKSPIVVVIFSKLAINDISIELAVMNRNHNGQFRGVMDKCMS